MISENAKSRWLTDFKNGVSLSYAPASVQDNKDLVMTAVSLNGMNLKFASERLKDDIEVVLEAMKQNVMALQFVNSDLREQIIFYGVKVVKARRKSLSKQVKDEPTLEEQKFYDKLINDLMKITPTVRKDIIEKWAGPEQTCYDKFKEFINQSYIADFMYDGDEHSEEKNVKRK